MLPRYCVAHLQKTANYFSVCHIVINEHILPLEWKWK